MRIGKEFNLFILNLKMMIPKRVMNLLILLLLNYPVYKYVSETETNVVQFGEMNVNYIIQIIFERKIIANE